MGTELGCGGNADLQWSFVTTSSSLRSRRFWTDKYKTGHVTYLFIWKKEKKKTKQQLWRFWFWLYRECLKKYNTEPLVQKSNKAIENCFLIFSAYCNCPCLSTQRGAYACLFYVKEKLLLFHKKGPMIQTLRVRTIQLALYALGGQEAQVNFLVLLDCRPWSSLVGSPVSYLLLDHLAFVYISEWLVQWLQMWKENLHRSKILGMRLWVKTPQVFDNHVVLCI